MVAIQLSSSTLFMRHAGGRKSLFTKLGPAPVSTIFATVGMAFDEIPTDFRMRKVALRKNDATSYGPSPHCKLKSYGLSGSGARACSFPDVSNSSVLLTSFLAGVTLSRRVGCSVDKSLWVTFDATSIKRTMYWRNGYRPLMLRF